MLAESPTRLACLGQLDALAENQTRITEQVTCDRHPDETQSTFTVARERKEIKELENVWSPLVSSRVA